MEKELTPAKGLLQTADTDILVKAANGAIDLNELAKEELVNRGLDKNGKWVGFGEAAVIHGFKKKE